MDTTEFQRRLQQAGGQAPTEDGTTPPTIEVDPEALQSVAEQVGIQLPTITVTPEDEKRPDGTSYSEAPKQEPGLGDPSSLDAIAGGALKSVFETKDFLFGDTPQERQSEFRQNVEETVKARSEQSIIDGFAAGLSQFATSMIGLGKLGQAAKLLPWVGKAASAVGAVKGGRVAAESAKAAVAGAVAFDPHEARLSNLIQDTPLANPVTEWLAASPEDSAAEGRIKAMLESIGLDATLIGVFMGSSKIWKALKQGDTEAAAREASKLEEDAQAAHAEEEGASPATEGATDTQGGPAADQPEVGAAQGEADNGGAPSAEGSEPPLGQDNVGAQDVAQGGEGVALKEPPKAANDTFDAGALPPENAAKAAPGKARVTLDTEDTTAIFEAAETDFRALANHGGVWTETVEWGHSFGKGAGIPYQKIGTYGELEQFMARVTDVAEERLDAVKGGSVLSDNRLNANVRSIAAMYNLDPAAVIGTIQSAGKEATHLAARMESSYLVATRMFNDAYATAMRISLGDYTKYGSRDAAVAALRQQLSLAASVYGAAKSMSSNAGRALRRMRSEFAIDPNAVEALNSVDPDLLTQLVKDTGGDPRRMAKVANPSLWEKVVDGWQFLLVNNLVSGWKTQLINVATNSYMLGVRPLERIIGAYAGAPFRGIPDGIVRSSIKQYAYMGAAFADSFQNATKAFVRNDSLLTPHKSEVYQANKAAAQGGIAPLTPTFKPWTSIGNVFQNALMVATTGIGVPTRLLGATDEFMKQMTYRSKLMADSYVEGVEKGVAAGMKDAQLEAYVKQYVADKLDNGFDAEGRGTSATALREANIATFQQDLLPKTVGKTFQNAVMNHPGLRIILPFVKTPTNVIRYGWKMTPGLNLLQTEYRAMLNGSMGEEAYAQAVGQMSLGTLFMGAAAFMVAEGRITGSGPADYKKRAELMATGWQPYSIVVKNEDGSKSYLGYGRYDPIAVPFGIIADMQDAFNNLDAGEYGSQAEAVIGGLLMAMSAQFRNKTYLLGISQAMDAIMGGDEKMRRYVNQTAANFIPFSAMLRQVDGDPYLREARTMADKFMDGVPGLSDNIPARYDAWGDPVLVRNGLWSSSEPDPVDLEVQRMALSGQSIIERPTPYHSGVDLRDVTMENGKNAYEEYQRLSGHLPGGANLKDLVRRIVTSEAYLKAPDGDVGTRGTKQWLISGPVSQFRSGAMRILKTDPFVREALLKDTMKVVNHYRGYTETSAPQQQGSSLSDVGEAFGVDLGTLDNAEQSKKE